MNKFQQSTNTQTFIGIDVSKDTLAIFIDSTEQHAECPNQTGDLRKLARRLKKLSPALIVLEATGGYENLAASIFSEFELPHAVVFPKRVRQFANGLGIMAKTDRVDAEVLAFYGRTAKIEPKPLLTAEQRRLQELTTRRQQLIEMRVAEENREGTAPLGMRKNIKKHIDWLVAQTSALDAEIAAAIKNSEDLKEKDDLLQSVPGVGEVLSATLICEMPELGQIPNKEIASLIGVAPFPKESGKFKGKRYCQGGRAMVRRVLYMATLSATRHNPAIKEFYDRLLAKGKIKKVAIIACARKLITVLNAMVKNNCAWNEQKIEIPA